MQTFWIRGGLSGSFGGVESQEWEEIQSPNEEGAYNEAYQIACDIYETYDGMYGLRTVDEIMEEDGIEDYSEALQEWVEARESWLIYQVSKERPEDLD